ncbi:hypothetical protein EGW08_018958 [Elysia chlorotica]|uniref:G-protein coupled receptors family 1 profile domain-containing protein n=1 Tax=Elysia chlorotica TaxID=188477 RepID=A0A3S1AVH0_ELYCH|nr:hypothetical protein EGW08_018958 [Elysia chlorotica]
MPSTMQDTHCFVLYRNPPKAMTKHLAMAEHNGMVSPRSSEPEPGVSMGEVSTHYATLLLKMYVNPALGLSGVFINLINTGIFYKMGLSDGVTQNFIVLSIFDGILAAAALVNSISYIMLNTTCAHDGPIAEHLQAIFWASVVSWPLSQIVSCVTTTVIAVVQCCCAVLPFRVKQILTRSRQLLAIAFFSLFFHAVMVYIFAATYILRITDLVTNMTQVEYARTHYDFLNIFTNMYLYISFIIVTLCMMVLILNFNRSSKFRRQSPYVSKGTDEEKVKAREIRAVQTVILVAAIFIICNLPTIILSIVRQVTPGFSVDGHLRNLYDFFLIFTETARLLNVDANIFIYLGFNSRYRTIFWKTFGKDSVDKTV